MLQVKKYQQLAAEDVRFDVPLADACYEDRNRFCQNVPPVRRAGNAETKNGAGLLALGSARA